MTALLSLTNAQRQRQRHLTGGSGRDTFVLAVGEGTNTITDFEVGIDFVGLGGDLSFGRLTFEGSSIRFGDKVLATLNYISTDSLVVADFA